MNLFDLPLSSEARTLLTAMPHKEGHTVKMVSLVDWNNVEADQFCKVFDGTSFTRLIRCM